MAARWVFVSDLHMFARRSQASRWEPLLRGAVNQADTVVFGGDIFDFRWSTLGSTDQTIREAIDWLQSLAIGNPQREFHYVMGNHDFNQRFAGQLDALSDDTENFQCHRYYLRAGDAIFLHGDVADRMTTHQQLIESRKKWLADETRHPLRHRMYDVAIGLRLHKMVARVIHNEQLVVRRLHSYLDDIGHANGDPADGGDANGGLLRTVYFGHTHARMDGVEHNGIRFFNGGAPLAGLAFDILPVQVAINSEVAKHR